MDHIISILNMNFEVLLKSLSPLGVIQVLFGFGVSFLEIGFFVLQLYLYTVNISHHGRPVVFPLVILLRFGPVIHILEIVAQI